MGKTGKMIEFEQETGKQSAILKFITGGQALEQKSYPKLGPYDYNMDYIAWLESKAEAYDRLMSGGKKTLKELANILGRVVVVNANGDIESFAGEPSIDLHYGFWYLDEDDDDYEDDRFLIPRDIINFNGDWKDSLTLPDGWEEEE